MVRKILLSITVVLLLGVSYASAQNKQITGRVISADGAPIGGVTIMVKGTQTGTKTNPTGEFTLSVPENGILSVTAVGYEPQQISVAGKTVLNVTMKSAIYSLDEVEVKVAFGTSTKEALTGSVGVMREKELEKHQTTNIVSALVGTVPGLQLRGTSGQPGSSATGISIRGINSMYAGREPLIIVDGAPFPASLANIPQSDIESISVLKDAASAALYGARGAAGVIIVTTKQSRTSKNAIINVDMKWGVNSRAVKTYDVITDPGEYYEAYYTQIYNQLFYGQGMSAEQADIQANIKMLSDLQYNAFTYPSGENLIVNGKLNPNATLGRKVTYNDEDYWIQPDNWLDAAYRKGMRQEYSTNITGGSDVYSYYMGLTYLNEEGIVPESNFERITARFKNEYQATSWLRMGANIGYVNYVRDENSNWGTGSSASNLFAFTSRVAPIYPIYIRTVDSDGNVSIKVDQYGNHAYDYGVAANGYGVTRPYLATGNPLGENRYNEYFTTSNQLNGSAFAEFKLADHLTLNINSSVTWQQVNTSLFGNMFYGTPANTGGYIEKSSTPTMRTNHIQTLAYNNSFGLHNLDAKAGHEYYNSTSSYLYGKGSGMFSPDIKEINAASTKTPNTESYSARYNNEGYLIAVQYNYDLKYYAQASFRRDASSRFAKEHRWGNFWSIGGSWIISKENFMAGTGNWLNMLKLRLSVGQQGNDNIGDYNYIDMYTLSPNDPTNMSAAFYRKGNPDITWETTTNINAGVEFSLWNGKLSGSIDVYSKKISDLLFWVSIPESSGSRGIYDNIGDMRNTGFELTLSSLIVNTRLISWSVMGNISGNTTKILSLPASKLGTAGGYTESSLWYEVGGPMYNYYCASFAGLDKYGQAMFYVDTEDAEGNTIHKGGTTYDFNSATKYAQGTNLPEFYGGFGTNLRVADFDFSISFDYQIGGKVYDGYYASIIGSSESSSGAGQAIHKDWIKAWSPNNTVSNMPRWQYGDQYGAAASNRFLTDASYLNLQTFTVGYNVPEKLFRSNVQVRIYVAGENLWFWSARKGLDPRFSFQGNSSVVSFSPYRTLSCGLKFTF